MTQLQELCGKNIKNWKFNKMREITEVLESFWKSNNKKRCDNMTNIARNYEIFDKKLV